MVCRPTCVSFRTMATFSQDLRLIKVALEELCSRFEALVDEMGEMRFSDEVERALATLRAAAPSPLLAPASEEGADEHAGDAGALPGFDDAAVALDENEDDFWTALRAAVADAPPFEESAFEPSAFEERAERHAATASDGVGEANERPAIEPSAGHDAHAQPDPSAAARSAVVLAAYASSLTVAGAASDQMVGATPAPIDVDPSRQSSRQSAVRRWSRYTALAALIAAIVVMALVSHDVTRGYTDFLLRIER
jgi:hypothetical protein